MASKTIQHPEWGPILLRKNSRAKRLILRIKEGQVQVTLPKHVSYQIGIDLINDKKAWIEERLTKAQAKHQLQGGQLELPMRNKTLKIVQHASPSYRIEYRSKATTIYIPLQANLGTPEVQIVLVETLRKEAKAYLPQRTRQLASQHRIPIQQVFIKNVKTRWGSCSSAGNINLSLHLMLLPDPWIDYVITHELAHIKHPNHSPAFWAHLEALMPGAGAIDQALKGYRRPF